MAIREFDATDPDDDVRIALTRRATEASDGGLVIGRIPDDWADADKTHAYAYDNLILDWLERHGRNARITPDAARAGYDPRFDPRLALARREAGFMQRILQALGLQRQVWMVNATGGAAREWAATELTLEGIARGAPIIAGGVLRDPDGRRYIRVPLIVRSDVLADFPYVIGNEPEEDFFTPAPVLGPVQYHYRAVMVRYAKLWRKASRQRKLAYRLQTFLANDILGRLQGYRPAVAYLLGTDWQTDGLWYVELTPELGEQAAEAMAWKQLVITEGAGWSLYPQPSRPELWPNLKPEAGGDWAQFLKEYGAALHELTALAYVMPDNRRLAQTARINRWDDPRVSSVVLGFNPRTERGKTVDALLDLNRSIDGSGVSPPRIVRAEQRWRETGGVEMVVSVQTAPFGNGEALVYLINWLVDGESGRLVAPQLSPEHETQLLREFRSVVERIASKHGVALSDVRVFTWARPERRFLQDLAWYELVERVVLIEPVTVRGALKFDLKTMGLALRRLGLIDASWPEHPTDGREALGAAINAYSDTTDEEVMHNESLIEAISQFGAANVNAISAILSYLRTNH